jgi:transcriptional regulator with XRE-family HTH domain
MTDSSERPSSDSQVLARKLREVREFINLSQQFVSKQTGISRSAISDIERGARKVESLELKRLADLYRMPVQYFLGDDMEDDDLAGASMDPTVTALARAASEMSEQDKQEVLRFALFLQNFERKSGDKT